MSTEKWKLTPSQIKAAQEWIESRCQKFSSECPLCKNTEWILTEYFVELRIMTPGINVIGGLPSFPQLQIICANCGCTQLINAIVSGVYSPPPMEADSNG